MVLLDWIDIIKLEFQNFFQGFINFIPRLIGAIVIFGIGWIFAVGIGKVITEILRRIKFNRIFEKGGWKSALEKAEIKVDISGFIGAICKWILMIVALVISVNILGLTQFSVFLASVLNYLPNVVVAVLIFVVAVIVADLLEKVVRTAVEGVRVGYGQIVGAIVRWSIWIFAILAILSQLEIEAADWILDLMKIVVMGMVAGLAIAFGLGGKEVAADLLQDLRRKLRK